MKSLLVYLRAMWTILWTAIRHPLTTTYVDLSTGKEVKLKEEN